MKLNVSENIESLIPYPPGKPLEELEREYGISGSIKLASNENALGPSPKAVTAIQKALTNLHRYPDGSCFYLAQALAEKIGVQASEIVFGNGSNELIELLVSTFLTPGQEVITSHPTFLVYHKMVQASGGVNQVVPLNNMCHDLPAIADRINEKTRLIFLDNPNNPTGTVFSAHDFETFLKQVPESVIVVLDEAYVDFVDPEIRMDARQYLAGKVPVVALRTFSKAYGLAGLRIGYGLMSEEIAGYINRVRQPFNVNTLAQVGALAAIGDDAHYRKTYQLAKDGFAWLRKEVEHLGCKVFPTQTNFFLIDVGMDCKVLYEKMLSKGVIIRPMAAYNYPQYIRITMGLEEENQRFVKALRQSFDELK